MDKKCNAPVDFPVRRSTSDGQARPMPCQHRKVVLAYPLFRYGCEAHPNVDSLQPSGRSTHESLWGFSVHGRLVFAPRRAWPIQPESSLMPPNNSFRQDEKERLLPLRPEVAREYPKQLIERPQSWPGMSAFQDSKLLPESKDFLVSGRGGHERRKAPLPAKGEQGSTGWQS